MAVSITQTANPAGVAAASTVATYSAVDIGAATADRIIAVLVGTELSSSTPSACTIDYGSGDTAMTAGPLGNQGISYARIFYLAVPTGTSATIKVTFSSVSPGSTANHIAVYRVIGASTTLSSSGFDASPDMDSSSPLTTGSITIPANGAFLALASCGADTQSKTWANATGDIDDDVGTFRFCTATRTTSGTVTVTCTGTGNGEDGGLSYLIFDPSASATAALTGTITTATEADIVTGGKTIILTLTGDTWVASGATFDAQRQNIINGIDSAQAEGTGWDAVVKAGLAVTDVARTSNTVVTITLPAFATYNITATETITATIPATALTGAAQLIASPTFNVTSTSFVKSLSALGVG